MPVLTSGLRPGAFVLQESGSRSRDNLTVLNGQNLKPGEICGIITATGKVKVLTPGASDGSEVAAVIPLYPYYANGADLMGAFVTTDTEVIEDALIFPVGISSPNRAAAIVAAISTGW